MIKKDKIQTPPTAIPHQTMLSDLGEISFLRVAKGIAHDDLILNDEGVVLFVYRQDLSDPLGDYWSDSGTVSARRFKVELDSFKRLVFSFLRSQGAR